MRNLTEHITNPANDKLIIMVADERGAGGANHRYEITGFDASTNPSENNENGTGATRCTILFQNGTIPEKGTNGITQEVLLAIVADRLRGFQSGQFKCKENACALTHIEEAMHWLQQRTIARMRRGVEGTHAV